jgi:putative DNA primase/helicase
MKNPKSARVSAPQDRIVEQTKQAIEYANRGWKVIPVEYQGKKPMIRNWTEANFSEQKLREAFSSEPRNIGVVLGDPSGGLIDTDLDCPEAIRAAPYILPATEMVFGRASAPASHWIYRAENPGRTEKFQAPGQGGMLVECRSNGSQTVFPGSVHSSGELIEFSRNGEPGQVDWMNLLRAAKELAAVSLIARTWTNGLRHSQALAFAGGMFNAGKSINEVKRFVRAICAAANDYEVEDRLTCVNTTFESSNRQNYNTGWPTLADLTSDQVVRKVKEWLGVGGEIEEVFDSPGQGLEAKFGDNARVDLIKNEAALARVFAKECAEVAVYRPDQNAWFLWNGRIWKKDVQNSIQHNLIAFNNDLMSFLVSRHEDPACGSYLKWMVNQNDARPIRNVLSLAQSMCAVDGEQFDRDPMLLTVSNGTLNLRTGNLREHRPEDRITKLVDIAYQPDADCPLFLAFLNRVVGGDGNMVAYLRRVLGYCLTGDTREQCWFIFHGNGANGKSTLIQVMSWLVEPYAMQAQAETFMAQKRLGASPDLARLEGARLVHIAESNTGHRLAEGLVKQITGGDKMAVRALYQNEREFRPLFKPILATNQKPDIRGVEDGTWRRIQLVPFDVTIPEQERDKQLPAKLHAELPGILNWAIEGCLEWQRQGGLHPPQAVIDAVDDYRQESDTFRQFMDDCVEDAPGRHCSNKDLFGRYKNWCEDNGYETLPQNQLSKELARRGFNAKKQRGYRGFIGIALKPANDDIVVAVSGSTAA